MPLFPTTSTARSLLLFHLLSSFPENELLSSLKSQELLNAMTDNRLGYQEILWRLHMFSPSSVRSTVSRLQQEGLVVTEFRQGASAIRLTAAGREEGLKLYPGLHPIAPKWDRTWRMLVFSQIQPQHHAAASYRVLREAIQDHGFAKLERGVYVSPFPIHDDVKRALSEVRGFGMCVLVETRRFLYGDEKSFAAQAWNLEEKYKAYTKLSSSIENMLVRLHREKTLNQSHKLQFLSLVERVSSLSSTDPRLPQELFPLESAQNPFDTLFFKLAAVFVQREHQSNIR